MLDAFIIEEIQRQEREKTSIRPSLERPIPRPSTRDAEPEQPTSRRGSMIIDRHADDDDNNGLTVIEM
jgi:hypothetical protein